MANELDRLHGGVPATDDDIERMMREEAGAGISQKPADNLVPRITLLQPLSPLVASSGAAAGEFVLGHDVVPGKTGFWFQPAFSDQLWLEFKSLDDGGGFVAAHPFTTEDDLPRGAKKYKPFRYRFPDSGNELIHYRQMAGIAYRDRIGLEFVLAFKSTGHTVARDWNTRAGRTNVLPDGRARALYNQVWKLTSTMVKKGPYTWYIVNVGDAVLLDRSTAVAADAVVGSWQSAFLRGRALHQAFASHEKVAEHETVRDDLPHEAADEDDRREEHGEPVF